VNAVNLDCSTLPCPSRKRRTLHWVVASVLVLATAVVRHDASAQAVAATDEVEAAYLHKFIGYVEWPPAVFATPGAPIVVGVVGSDKVYAHLSAIAAGRPVRGRDIEVRRLLRPEQGASAHMIFVGSEAWQDLPKWASIARQRPLLIATDAPHGIERGAALGFVQAGQRVRFEASLLAAEQSGIKLSSRLLVVAERVIGASP
jgi:hypothetical protein